MLLMAWRSTHIFQVSSFVGTSDIYIAQRLILSQIYPFIISSYTCLWSSSSPRVPSIGWTVRNRSSWYKVNLIFNSPY
jgi:hypothetical protein